MSITTRETTPVREQPMQEKEPIPKLDCDGPRSRKHGLHEMLDNIIERLNAVEQRLAHVDWHTQTITVTKTTAST